MISFIKIYILSYDTILSLIISFIGLYFLPNCVDGELVKDLLGVGIGVLSIVFLIFFAALAFIISASDDEFVSFLEETGLFSQLIDTFKWTVGSLFISLLYSIVLYVIVAFNLSFNDDFKINEYLIALFCFLFFYSLFATVLSTNDAIKYSKKRITYIEISQRLKKEDEENK